MSLSQPRLTSEERIGVLLDHVSRLRARLLDMLQAPYQRNMPWATTAACIELGHPTVRNDGKSCACGKKS